MAENWKINPLQLPPRRFEPLNVLIQETFGSAIRVYAFSWVSILVHDFAFSYGLPALASTLIMTPVVYLSAYISTMFFANQSFKLVPKRGDLLPIFATRIVGQLIGAILGAALTRATSSAVTMAAPYMQCGPFLHEAGGSTGAFLILACVGSWFVTISSLISNNRNLSESKKASLMAIAYSLVSILCYPIGGVVDAVAFVGSNIVNGCWDSSSLIFIGGHMIGVDARVYILGDLAGVIMSYAIYVGFIKRSLKAKAS